MGGASRPPRVAGYLDTLGRMSSHTLLRYGALVLAGVIGYLALWWLTGVVVRAETTTFWFLLVIPVLITLQTIAPAFLAGWISGSRGAVLGALIGFCGAIAQETLYPSPALTNALLAAPAPMLIGVVAGMAGELIGRRKHAP